MCYLDDYRNIFGTKVVIGGWYAAPYSQGSNSPRIQFFKPKRLDGKGRIICEKKVKQGSKWVDDRSVIIGKYYNTTQWLPVESDIITAIDGW